MRKSLPFSKYCILVYGLFIGIIIINWYKPKQIASSIEISGKWESENEYEIEDVRFNFITTQNPTKNFTDEMKVETVINTTCITTLTE